MKSNDQNTLQKIDMYTDVMDPMRQYVLDTPLPSGMSALESLARSFTINFQFGGTEINVTAVDNTTKLPLNVHVSTLSSISSHSTARHQQMTATARFASTAYPC